MKELFEEWYVLHKKEIEREYAEVNQQRYGYGQHYNKYENSFKEFADHREIKEDHQELIEYSEEEHWNIISALIEKGRKDGYYK